MLTVIFVSDCREGSDHGNQENPLDVLCQQEAILGQKKLQVYLVPTILNLPELNSLLHKLGRTSISKWQKFLGLTLLVHCLTIFLTETTLLKLHSSIP